MVRKGADKMAMNDQKCWSQPGFQPGSFQGEKKSKNILSKALPLPGIQPGSFQGEKKSKNILSKALPLSHRG